MGISVPSYSHMNNGNKCHKILTSFPIFIFLIADTSGKKAFTICIRHSTNSFNPGNSLSKYYPYLTGKDHKFEIAKFTYQGPTVSIRAAS